MTKKEIREAIEENKRTMESAKAGIATIKEYRIGKVVGMLSAFKTAGFITDDEMFELLEELI